MTEIAVELGAPLRVVVPGLGPRGGLELVLERLPDTVRPVGGGRLFGVQRAIDEVQLVALRQRAAVHHLQVETQGSDEVAHRLVLGGDQLAAMLDHDAREERRVAVGPSADAARGLIDGRGDAELAQQVGRADPGRAAADDHDSRRAARGRRRVARQRLGWTQGGHGRRAHPRRRGRPQEPAARQATAGQPVLELREVVAPPGGGSSLQALSLAHPSERLVEREPGAIGDLRGARQAPDQAGRGGRRLAGRHSGDLRGRAVGQGPNCRPTLPRHMSAGRTGPAMRLAPGAPAHR